MRHEAKLKVVLLGALAAGLLLLPPPAQAQRHEVTGFIGYTTPPDVEKTASEITQLEIAGSFTWGAQFSLFFGPHMGLEVSWAQQETRLRLTTNAGSASPFDTDAGQLHANFFYQFSGQKPRVRPYILAGLGATFFRSANLNNETKLSRAITAALWTERPKRGFDAR